MANGSFAGGTGSVLDPFLIEDALDLNAVRNNLTANYKLIKDIDLNIAPYNTGEGWIPIGNANYRFYGHFYGNGFKILNLFINRQTINYQGLFGYCQGAEISNIGVINVNVTGNGKVGALIGAFVSDNSKVSNSYSTGTVRGYNGEVGGLIGEANDNVIISNSYSHASVIGGRDHTGGLIGNLENNSRIYNSYSTGSVIGNLPYLYGFSSLDSGSLITNSYWDTETSGQSQSGSGAVGKTTIEMKTPSTFIDWDKEKLANGKNVWILKDGEYPKLWFDKPPNKYLIKQDSQYYSIKPEFYSESSDSYDPQLITDLSVDKFDNYGIDDLSSIRNTALNKLITNKYNVALLK